MRIEAICIDERDNSLQEFIRKDSKDSVLLIKNIRLAKRLQNDIKNIKLEKIQYMEGKYIFIVISNGKEYTLPNTLEDVRKVYYIYSNTRAYCINNQIVESMTNEQILRFLENNTSRKWKIFSRRIEEGQLYVTLRVKWARGPKTVEFRFSDTSMSIWDIDYHWKNYVYDTLLKPMLTKFFEQ